MTKIRQYLLDETLRRERIYVTETTALEDGGCNGCSSREGAILMLNMPGSSVRLCVKCSMTAAHQLWALATKTGVCDND